MTTTKIDPRLATHLTPIGCFNCGDTDRLSVIETIERATPARFHSNPIAPGGIATPVRTFDPTFDLTEDGTETNDVWCAACDTRQPRSALRAIVTTTDDDNGDKPDRNEWLPVTQSAVLRPGHWAVRVQVSAVQNGERYTYHYYASQRVMTVCYVAAITSAMRHVYGPRAKVVAVRCIGS